MSSSNSNNKTLFSYETLVHAIAGSAGSVVGMAVFYPLDTVRCRKQLEENAAREGTLSMLRKIIKEEGVEALYRGVIPVLQSLCASNFVYFYSFHGLRSGVTEHTAGSDLLLGAIAGAINVMITTPLWVVNTRLKMGGTPYNSLAEGVYHVAKSEGRKGLWASVLPSLLLVCNPALQFAVYESIKRKFSPTGGQLPALAGFFIGAMSKAIGTILTYPIQVVQAKLRHSGSKVPGGGDIIPLLASLMKQKGVKGMFSGLEAKLMQTILTAALMFATYEKIALFVFSLLGHSKKLSIKH